MREIGDQQASPQSDAGEWGSGATACWLGDCRRALQRMVCPDHHIARLAEIEVRSHRITASLRRLSKDEVDTVCGGPLEDAEQREVARMVTWRATARDHLQRLAAADGHAVQGDALTEWAIGKRGILRRLGDAGHLPARQQ